MRPATPASVGRRPARRPAQAPLPSAAPQRSLPAGVRRQRAMHASASYGCRYWQGGGCRQEERRVQGQSRVGYREKEEPHPPLALHETISPFTGWLQRLFTAFASALLLSWCRAARDDQNMMMSFGGPSHLCSHDQLRCGCTLRTGPLRGSLWSQCMPEAFCQKRAGGRQRACVDAAGRGSHIYKLDAERRRCGGCRQRWRQWQAAAAFLRQLSAAHTHVIHLPPPLDASACLTDCLQSSTA